MLLTDKPEREVSQGTMRTREWRARRKAGIKGHYRFTCVVCGTEGLSGYPQTKSCKPCRPTARQRSQRAHTGAVAIGTEFNCNHCGESYAKTHKRQKYCQPCSDLSTANKLPHVREWNRNYQREYQKRRRQESAAAAINARMSAGIKNSLASGKQGRSWEALVGFTVADLMAHLEAQFVRGMGWHNRGEWHIDHIRPLCSFEFQTPDCPQFREAWTLSNLRPLWARDNLRKGGRLDLLI